jgi:hypothetical protein
MDDKVIETRDAGKLLNVSRVEDSVIENILGLSVEPTHNEPCYNGSS